MIKFEKEKVLLLQNLLIKSTGGKFGVRDMGLLDSALESAFQTFGGKELYPTKQEKAARLAHSLISNHAFVDGNKRIGVLVMLSFLEINGIKLVYTDQELIDLGIAIAGSAYEESNFEYEQLLDWIKKHEKY